MRLSADIDSGRTGDKNPALDPSLAPLGTDDEAAGTPPTPFRVMLARRLENLNRWVRSSSSAPGPKPDSDLILFLSAIGAISLVLLAGVVFAARVSYRAAMLMRRLSPGTGASRRASRKACFVL